MTKTVGILLTLAMLCLLPAIAPAQDCPTSVAQMITPADGATLQPNPATGAIDFTWCNARADYFVIIETVSGAHDLFFNFAGGAGAGITTLSVGPACAPTNPKLCIPPNGEQLTFILETVKSKKTIGINTYHFTAPSKATARADFSIASSQRALTVAPGATASTVLTITGQAGYNGIVNFACTGLPANSTCAFDPATVAGGGTTTMTIATTPAAALHPSQLNWVAALGGISFAGLLFVGSPLRRGGKSRRHVLLLGLLLGSLMTVLGCGGAASNVTPPRTGGTPVGSTTVTVTASDGVLTHSTTLTLTVQ